MKKENLVTDATPFTSLKVRNLDGTERLVTKKEIEDWIADGMPIKQEIGMAIGNPNCLSRITINADSKKD